MSNNSKYSTEKILSVHHWNDTLFSFKTTRQDGLRFENGQFVIMGTNYNYNNKTYNDSKPEKYVINHRGYLLIKCIFISSIN